MYLFQTLRYSVLCLVSVVELVLCFSWGLYDLSGQVIFVNLNLHHTGQR